MWLSSFSHGLSSSTFVPVQKKKKKKCFLNIHKKYHDTSGHNFKVLPITFRIEFNLLTLVLYGIWLTTNYPLKISSWNSLILEAPATSDFF